MVDLGLIPAAGAGVRAYPTTHYIPKPLLTIAGDSLIERNVRLLRDQLGIREIVVVVGHLGDQLRAELGDGSALGVQLTFVECPDPAVGLAKGILMAEEHLPRPFACVLGDELYLDTNHAEAELPFGDWVAGVGIMRGADPAEIRKNYSVRLEGNRVLDLVEKPEEVTDDVIGVGSYFFTPEIFDLIRQTPPSMRTGRVELTDVIAKAARELDAVFAFELCGHYLNVNTVEDYNTANYLARSAHFDRYRVSVVIPALNEEDVIADTVDDYISHPAVHEVLVVDNQSTDETAKRARGAGARVETVAVGGYGDAITWGLDHAAGELLIVTEADHTFRAKDLGKILEYLKDADMVVGTRTTREMIEQGTNMQGIVRWANVFTGKLVEVLWWDQEPRFTDVGCSYRGIWRDSWEAVRPQITGHGPEFSPEMMIEVLRARRRVIEIPVSYYPRRGGESKHSQSMAHLARTALRMLRLILRKRRGGR